MLVQFHAEATIRDMTVLIAMPSPWLPETAVAGAAVRAALPELPVLERLLRAGRRLPQAPDWRGGVLAALAIDAAGVPPIAVAARALAEAPSDDALCFAAPLHVVAGISRVHLPPGGRLHLDAIEAQAWCAGFNQEFGSGSVRMHVAAPGTGWLLQAPFAVAARDAAPETLAGAALQRSPARDADERQLRRLGTEIEMWLADHALNRQREARREPPLNAIWHWGGGRRARLPPLPHLQAVLGNRSLDPWLAGLSRHAGAAAAVAGRWSEAIPHFAAAGGAQAPTSLIVLEPEADVASAHFWQMVEELWIAPAAAALAAGTIGALQLQMGRHAWRLPDRSPRRWLRWRRRRWWQMAGEVRA
jgi:hypothetical protein